MIKWILIVAIIIFYAIRLRRSVLRRIRKNKINWSEAVLELIILGIVIMQLSGYDPLRYDASEVVHWSGLVLAIGGAIFSSVARLTLKKNYVPAQASSRPENLVTGGIYKIVRHPSYLGSLLAFVGLEIAVSSYFISLVVILFPFLIKQIKKEEKILSESFGEEWQAFIKKTPYRLFPFVY